MPSPTQTAEYIQFIARTYKDDFNGYRRDILGMADAKWQDDVGDSVMANKRTAVSSGHGIGKTAFGASAIHWFLATRPHPAIVATANTEDQLNKKLWREISKINGKAKNRDWFDWKASSFTMFNDPTAQAVALAWSENNPEAFAGTHEDHVLGVFDEGSGIARNIYNTFAGAMTTPGARWLIMGNPTKNEGYFFDACFGKTKARKPGDAARGMWNSFVVPCSASPFVDPSYIEEMRNTLGEESDEYRIRVLGLHPKSDAEQYISRDWVTKAMDRTVPMFKRWPLIIGADVGRGDRSVLVPRRGRIVLDNVQILTGERTTDFARRIAAEIKMYRDDQGLFANVVIEELGMGVGTLETLQDMGFSEHVWGVNTGNPAHDPNLYMNLRNEMWGLTKEWLEDDVELPNLPDLSDDLCSIKRKRNARGVLRLETKEEMRARGLRSPDIGDALALTFAIPFDLLPERPMGRHDDYRDLEPVGGTWMGN